MIKALDRNGHTTYCRTDAFQDTSAGTYCRQYDSSLLLNGDSLWPFAHLRLCRQGLPDVVPGRTF